MSLNLSVSAADVRAAFKVRIDVGFQALVLLNCSGAADGTAVDFVFAARDDVGGPTLTARIKLPSETQTRGSRAHLIRMCAALRLIETTGGTLPESVDDFEPALGRVVWANVVHEHDEGGQLFAKIGHGQIASYVEEAA